MNNQNDLVFECKKCGHLLFITGTSAEKIKKIIKLKNYACPNCGAEREGNWSYLRKGNYEKEYGNKVVKDHET